MAAKDRAAKAGRVAQSARANPYIQRLIADEELRESIRSAYTSGRSAYGRLNNGKAPTRALMEDKKLHKELRSAARSLQDASNTLRAPARRQRKGGMGRMLMIGLIGAGLAIALNESLRSKVLDALFGSEEEFDYTSTTVPATPAPEPAAAS